MSWDEGLTAKQKSFVYHYVELMDATKAAVAAGYSKDSRSAAAVTGWENLRKPKILDAIEKFQAEMRLVVSPERLALELLRMASIDPADFFDKDNQLLPIREMPLHARQSIDSVDVKEVAVYSDGDITTETTTSKIKFQKRLDVMNSLIRMTGGFKDSVKIDGLDELFEIVSKSGKSRPQDNIKED